MTDDKTFNKIKKLCNELRELSATEPEQKLSLEQFQELLTILVKAREKVTAE